MKLPLLHFSCLALLLAGCSTLRSSDTQALQGTWKGHETEAGRQGQPATVTFSGHTLEFHGASADDWLKGTFTLREDTQPRQITAVITDCANHNAIGETVNAIYQLETGTLKLAGNAPGHPERPASFDEPGARSLELKKQ